MSKSPPLWRHRAIIAFGEAFSPMECMNTGGPTAAIVSATGFICHVRVMVGRAESLDST
jgi:hypothetical protein